MVEPFTPIPNSIVASTIWVEKPSTFKVWMTLILNCNSKGIFRGTIPGLANIAVVSVEECREAVSRFLAPDPDSRTKEFEGRRMEPIDGGWRLLNHRRQRELMGIKIGESTERVREWRANQKQQSDSQSVTLRNVGNGMKRDQEEEVDRDPNQDPKEEKKQRTATATEDGYCPADLQLDDDQKSVLEMNLGMKDWQIQTMTTEFVVKKLGDKSDMHKLHVWKKFLAKAITQDWNSGKHPQQLTESDPNKSEDGLQYG